MGERGGSHLSQVSGEVEISLLDQLPHVCTIRYRTRSKGTLGGSKDSFTSQETGVRCWEQAAGDNEVLEYQKRGIRIARKVYFTSDPGVTERHQILVTSRNGTAVSSPIPLDVRSRAMPDASAGLGVLYRVMCDEHTGEDD